MEKPVQTPLIISSSLGGPFCIYLCTPLRNALTLGARDPHASMRQLYREVFRGGLRAGWTGGGTPAMAACPQFFAVGPVYHNLNGAFKRILGVDPQGQSTLASVMASCGAGVTETAITFGSSSRNAQMAFNEALRNSSVKGRQSPLALNRSYQIWGVGATVVALRNSFTIASVRAMSPVLEQRMPESNLRPKAKATVCDAVASVIACVVSSPMHQTFNFMVTTPEAKNMPFKQRLVLISDFLNRQYFVPKSGPSFSTHGLGTPPVKQTYSWMINSVALRDFGMRALYITTVLTLFTSIERNACSLYFSWTTATKDSRTSAPALVPMLQPQS